MKLSWIITTLLTIIFLAAAAYVLIFVGPALFAKSLFFSSSPKPSPSTSIKPNSSPSPFPSHSPTTSPTPVPSGFSYKTYHGRFFTLQYPNTWGILTCSNSYSIEFDPTSPLDMNDFLCDRAIKPISVILNNDLSDCPGESSSIGNINVLKSTYNTEHYTHYKWCTITQPVLSFTNRVSTVTNFAATPNPFINEVEQIIKSLSFSK